MNKHNSTRTGSAKSADYHIVFKDGQWKVYDKAGRFRLSFATQPAAQAYVAMRSGAASHNNALSDERQAA